MITGLERLGRSPDPSPSRLPIEPTPQLFNQVVIGGRQVQIWTLRKQLGAEITAHMPNGSKPGEALGTVKTDQLVVNAQSLRLLSISGADAVRRALHTNLFAFARENRLHVYPSERIDDKTKEWLAKSGLPDSYINPDI